MPTNKRHPIKSQTVELGAGKVDMVNLKELATKHLPIDSQLRALITSEPDYLPRHDAIVKIQIYSKLLDSELRHLPNVKK